MQNFKRIERPSLSIVVVVAATRKRFTASAPDSEIPRSFLRDGRRCALPSKIFDIFPPRTAEHGGRVSRRGNEERRGAKFTVDFGNSRGVLARTIYLGTGRRQTLARTIYFAYREMLNPRTRQGLFQRRSQSTSKSWMSRSKIVCECRRLFSYLFSFTDDTLRRINLRLGEGSFFANWDYNRCYRCNIEIELIEV